MQSVMLRNQPELEMDRFAICQKFLIVDLLSPPEIGKI
jgi:hypothetical protein